MRARVLAVNWHDQQPVYSLDFLDGQTLVTAGGDKEVRIWQVTQLPSGLPEIKYLDTLTSHAKAVNCVRFSPSGGLLACGGDGGELSIWKLEQPAAQDSQTGLQWRRGCVLRGHAEDVQDIAWAPDSSALVSASVENSCIVWDVEAGKGRVRLEGHKHFVQGVAWHPGGSSIVSLSCDRTARVWGPKSDILSSIRHAAVSWDCKPAKQFLFHDETLSSFFRRPAWAPDGSFLLMPAGIHQRSRAASPVNAALAFCDGSWTSPVFHMPAVKPVVAARFSPVLYRRRPHHSSDNAAFQQPYRMLFALATLDSVAIYDTQMVMPLAFLGSLHLDRITDLAWSTDGQLLAVSSYDGFCSIAAFAPGELGEPMPLEELPPHLQLCMAAACKARPAAAAKAEMAAAQMLPTPATPSASALPEPSPGGMH
ncbi:hypothetical protein WJX73_006467 [Symbiochloris irregularis]|uniref:CAF1B/HIR1 beta-propeller domain-containing protein n=1 Tax=Symbiochloris irregularis TaxID=706552 RepID=A0AAW1PJL2_9CHLO